MPLLMLSMNISKCPKLFIIISCAIIPIAHPATALPNKFHVNFLSFVYAYTGIKISIKDNIDTFVNREKILIPTIIPANNIHQNSFSFIALKINKADKQHNKAVNTL